MFQTEDKSLKQNCLELLSQFYRSKLQTIANGVEPIMDAKPGLIRMIYSHRDLVVEIRGSDLEPIFSTINVKINGQLRELHNEYLEKFAHPRDWATDNSFICDVRNSTKLPERTISEYCKFLERAMEPFLESLNII